MQNDLNQDTSHTINGMMSDERTDEANSEASDDLYMVNVDDSDDAYEVDISNPSSDVEDSAVKVIETSGSKDASAELLSSVGSAASQENSQRTFSSRQYQAFIERKRSGLKLKVTPPTDTHCNIISRYQSIVPMNVYTIIPFWQLLFTEIFAIIYFSTE